MFCKILKYFLKQLREMRQRDNDNDELEVHKLIEII